MAQSERSTEYTACDENSPSAQPTTSQHRPSEQIPKFWLIHPFTIYYLDFQYSKRHFNHHTVL